MTSTDSEEWLLTCLARHLLRMPLADRRAFLSRWQKNHGAVSAEKVKAAVVREYNTARNGKKGMAENSTAYGSRYGKTG